MDVTKLDGAGFQPPPPPPVVGTRTAGSTPQAAPATVYEDRQVDTARGPDPLRRAVAAVNTSIASYMRHLSINFHEATGRNIVTVYDSETNKAIREIPPEKVLDAHASILELAGLFMDRRG